jgi:TolA-binding protein
MNAEAWGMLFVLGLLALITVVIVVFIWQIFATSRARASAAREEAYQKLAERAAAAQESAAQEQQKISENLSDLRTKVAAIEKLLREVG